MRKKGFTLIEMLAVVIIISILAGLVMASANAARQRAYRTRAQAEVKELAKAWKSYWLVYTNWPTTLQGAQSQVMDGPTMEYLLGGNKLNIKFMDLGEDARVNGYNDPWGRPYVMDFRFNMNVGSDWHETTVWLANRDRSRYD